MLWRKSVTEKKLEQKLEQIDGILKRSFFNVKKDAVKIFQWLNYLYHKNIEHEQQLKQIQSNIFNLTPSKEEIKKVVDYHYPLESILAKLSELDSKVSRLIQAEQAEKFDVKARSHIPHTIQIDSQNEELQKKIYSIEKRLELTEQKKQSIKEKITNKFIRNSKGYIKGIIVSYIKKYEKISSLELKDLIVDEQNFCSKSSFYRLLKEVEQLEDIGIINQGRKKYYLSRLIKRV